MDETEFPKREMMSEPREEEDKSENFVHPDRRTRLRGGNLKSSKNRGEIDEQTILKNPSDQRSDRTPSQDSEELDEKEGSDGNGKGIKKKEEEWKKEKNEAEKHKEDTTNISIWEED